MEEMNRFVLKMFLNELRNEAFGRGIVPRLDPAFKENLTIPRRFDR